MSRRSLLLTVLAAATLPYLIGLGDSTIWDANEAFYAETAREMVESGDYVNPSFNYQPRFNKPVLSYWIVAASYHVFGVSERSERLPIAMAALVLIATAFGLGRAAAGSVDAGLHAAVAMATMPRFLMFSRRIIIDVWITMFMALTLLCFVLAETRPQHRRRYLLLMYVAAGLGVLTKGPVAVALPALAFLVYLAMERRLGDLRRMMLPAGTAIVALIVLPWYLAVYAEHGWQYIKEFFIDENVMRYAQPVGAPRRGPFFYLPVLLSDPLPWSLFLPAAVVSAWPALRRRGSATTAEDRARRILLVWIAAIVLFFTFSSTKQDLYIYPVVPAEMALIGAALATGGRDSRSSVWGLAAAGALSVALGVVLLAVIVVPGRLDLAGSLAVSVVALAGGVLAIGAAWKRDVRWGITILGSTFAALSWVFVVVTLPDFERYKPVAPLADVIAQRAGPEARIGYYRFALPSMAFYLQRPVFEYADAESLRSTFASGEEVYCLMTAEDYEAVRSLLPGPTYVVARRPLFDVKLRTLLEGTALPAIVLVSNRP